MIPNSVIRVFATCQERDHASPWQSESPREGSGSGVVIGENLVLTGAHVVANSTFVQVKKISHPDKMVARVTHVCHDCDLALLEVEDARFMAGIEPAELDDLPSLGDRISVIGFPVGGDEMSVTEGIVSRIEVSRYTHSKRWLLTVTVDAAINSGNSGGPVFRKDKVAGIAFQVLEDAENIGELVPAPIVRRFVEGVKQGRVLDMPSIGVHTQYLENATLRRRIGMAEDDTGVLVTDVPYGCAGWGKLRKGDILLAIAGHAVANNGTVIYRGKFRTGMQAVVSEGFVGDKIEVEILRNGKRSKVELALQPFTSLVPNWRYDVRPTYFIFAGLVFQVLTLDYLATWKEWWKNSPKELLYLYYFGVRSEERREVVFLSDVLNDAINIGYSEFHEEPIVSVNDTPICDMHDLVRVIESSDDIVDMRTSLDNRMVIDVAEAKERAGDILTRYDIPADRSADLREGAAVPTA